MAYRKKSTVEVTDLSTLLQALPDLEVPRARREELDNLGAFYDGSKAATSYKNFPSPDGSKDIQCQYDNQRHNLLLVNRVKCVTRTWLSLTNGDITREVNSCPNHDIIEPYINSHEYNSSVGDWKRNSILYGTQVAVPVFDPETEEIDLWLPFPTRTVIITSKTNIKKILAVVEIHEDWCQFSSIWCEGTFNKKTGEAKITEHEWSTLPCAVGYGYSRLHERNVYGSSMCHEALRYSIAETNALFNVALLARQQTRDILYVSGDLSKISMNMNNPDVNVGLSDDGTLVLPEGFGAQFLKPSPLIDKSIAVAKLYQSLFSSVSAIPADIVAPDLVSNPSNESARIRSTALQQEAKDVIPRWLSAETQLIYSIIYLVDYYKSEQSPATNFADIKKRSEVEVKNNYQILPTSPNELTQNEIALTAAGLRRRYDAIKLINPHLTTEDIEEMIEEYAAKLASGENPHAVEQFALKSSKEALTPEQKAALENEE